MLRMIIRALMYAISLPFALIDGALRAIWPHPHFEVEEFLEPETTAREDLIAVKRWASAKLREDIAEPVGRYGAWLRGLDHDCALLIARANESGRLVDHLTNIQQFCGLPPAHLGTPETRRWLKERNIARRRTLIAPAPDESPRALATGRRLRRDRQGISRLA